MEVPIPLRFFEKLNLFQEFRKLERENSREWKNERPILSWAANSKRNTDLYTPLHVQMALDYPDITGPIPADVDDPRQYILNRFGCLVMRGYAEWSDGVPKEAIRPTRAGFLLGEMANEIKRPRHKRPPYGFSLFLCWVIVISSAFLLVGEAVKMIYDLRAFVSCSWK